MIHGGYMIEHFDGPGLQMTRALGDKALNNIIDRTPDVYTLPLGRFVLLATDGLFDPSHVADVKTTAESMASGIAEGDDASTLLHKKRPYADNATAVLWTRDPVTIAVDLAFGKNSTIVTQGGSITTS